MVHAITPSGLEQSDSGFDDASAYYLYPNQLQILDSCSIALPRGDHIMTGSLTRHAKHTTAMYSDWLSSENTQIVGRLVLLCKPHFNEKFCC
ncbi:hypothetical protein [Pseudoalteromonas sp. OOF1S-7]|uniref:hypothetical protein n=1 Tax=Pseudoalteromonas sp. OOF1S-7 TaxID=2917757 RepID=UPI001EF6E432|nr:hypothetical protein [Pseudoalteromonas sp. OOF1S-7]MCG7533922.1 hypothetical protein [Pseudoalteromonas sp. OOF1S-7]